MISLWIWTPNRLKVEVVKVYIILVFAYEINCCFAFRVCERAVLAVLTFTSEAHSAKFGSVFVWVVKFFNSGVTVDTGITLWALLLFCDVTTKF